MRVDALYEAIWRLSDLSRNKDRRSAGTDRSGEPSAPVCVCQERSCPAEIEQGAILIIGECDVQGRAVEARKVFLRVSLVGRVGDVAVDPICDLRRLVRDNPMAHRIFSGLVAGDDYGTGHTTITAGDMLCILYTPLMA